MEKTKKMVRWVKNNKREVILICTTAVVVGGTVWLIQSNAIRNLKMVVDCQSDVIGRQADRIRELKRICAAKDEYVKTMGSRMVRAGWSEGGKLMASRKAYLRAC